MASSRIFLDLGWQGRTDKLDEPSDQPPAGSGYLQLPARLKDLRARITRAASSKDPAIRALLPDVEIYYRAVSDALTYNEFFSAADVKKAGELLATGATGKTTSD